MLNELKLASWNLCLGLANKKDLIAHTLNQEIIDICALQECEVSHLIDEKNLAIKNYRLELKGNDVKRRSGFYIKNLIDYVRRKDLESKNVHLLTIDVNNTVDYRIICLYRTFSVITFLPFSRPNK